MLARRALPVLALLLVACATSNPSNPVNPGANPEVTPSCLPPGYRPRAAAPRPTKTTETPGKELDVLLAVVEGEVITRRRLVREVGGLAPGQDPAQLEAQVQRKLLERARLLVFVKEAERIGLHLPEHIVDEALDRYLKKQVEEAEKTTGQPVTTAEWLAEQGFTREEFRQRVKEEQLYLGYVERLKHGIGGPTRPQVDMEVTPADVRRIYWKHPEAFDEKPAVRFALFQISLESYMEKGTSPLDAEDAANKDAEALAQGLRQGEKPAELAKRFHVTSWNASKEGEFAEKGGRIRQLGEKVNGWLFDPARKAGDATVFPEYSGPVVMGVIEVKPGRHISYEEAYPKVVQLVRAVREHRLVEEELIRILSSRNVVQPPALASRLVADARKTLAEIDADPVLAAARFR